MRTNPAKDWKLCVERSVSFELISWGRYSLWRRRQCPVALWARVFATGLLPTDPGYLPEIQKGISIIKMAVCWLGLLDSACLIDLEVGCSDEILLVGASWNVSEYVVKRVGNDTSELFARAHTFHSERFAGACLTIGKDGSIEPTQDGLDQRPERLFVKVKLFGALNVRPMSQMMTPRLYCGQFQLTSNHRLHHRWTLLPPLDLRASWWRRGRVYRPFRPPDRTVHQSPSVPWDDIVPRLVRTRHCWAPQSSLAIGTKKDWPSDSLSADWPQPSAPRRIPRLNLPSFIYRALAL